jgi:hypothetical protein
MKYFKREIGGEANINQDFLQYLVNSSLFLLRDVETLYRENPWSSAFGSA